ncbi:hypothetical protein BRC90_03555 [Halobacteriales archaeon QS_4_69_34]|nr:MAG: hypothetical protein BRC90_03555 [Halobacteriales archaeon QS_4_69_34]
MDGPFDAKPAATAVVGELSSLDEPDKPHSIIVWNAAPRARTIGVRLISSNGDEPVFQEQYDLASNRYVEWSLAMAGYFDVEVAIDGSEFKTADAEIHPSLIDCNGSSTSIRVGEDGELSSKTTSTAMGCPDDFGVDPNRTVGPEVTMTGG